MRFAPVFALSAALLAGCASAPDLRQAQAGCQVQPLTTASVVTDSRRPPQPELYRKWAQADLARTGYRQAHRDDVPSATEEALRNCW